MKKMISKFGFAVLFGAVFFLASCGGGNGNYDNDDAASEQTEQTSEEASTTEATDESGPEYTSAYVCSMHCKGSGSHEAGTCPKCGMEYIANADFKEDSNGHEGHDHE